MSSISFQTVTTNSMTVLRDTTLKGNLFMDQINLNANTIHHANRLRVKDFKARTSRVEDLHVYRHANFSGNLVATSLRVGDRIVIDGDLVVRGNINKRDLLEVKDYLVDNVVANSVSVSGNTSLNTALIGTLEAGQVSISNYLSTEALGVLKDVSVGSNVSCQQLMAESHVETPQLITSNITTLNSHVGNELVVGRSIQGKNMTLDGDLVIHGNIIIPSGNLTQGLRANTMEFQSVKSTSIDSTNIRNKTGIITETLNCLSDVTIGGCTSLHGHLKVHGDVVFKGRVFTNTPNVSQNFESIEIADTLICNNLIDAPEARVGNLTVRNIDVIGNIRIQGSTIGNGGGQQEQFQFFQMLDHQQTLSLGTTWKRPHEFVAPFDMKLTQKPFVALKRSVARQDGQVHVIIEINGNNIFTPVGNLIVSGGNEVSDAPESNLSSSALFISKGSRMTTDIFMPDPGNTNEYVYGLQMYMYYERL